MVVQSLGRQLVVEYYGCKTELLDDVEFVRQRMREAAIAAGATIVGDIFHHFSPYGVSGVVVIAESHLAIHTWPEYGYAAVDLFTCGDEVNPYLGFNLLKEVFQSERYSVQEIRRGMEDEIGRPIRHKPEEAAVA